MGINTYNQYELDQQGEFNHFLSKVFTWMFVGLSLTGITAFLVATNESLINAIILNRTVFLGLIFGELAVVMFLSFRVHKLSFGMALGTFLLYSIMNGLTLSVVLLRYTTTSVALVFGGSALIFGVMAIYGFATKTDLEPFRALLMMGIFGMIIMSVINMFMRSAAFDPIIGYLGVAVFSGLTAYDIQKLKKYHKHSSKENHGDSNMAIIGALMLYLDFINIFLSLLRITGNRR
ncbi:MAG: hypothetical protein CVU84_12030 [Firmicutes bacterium HGW-Firmicutes-1]|jgi:hypothetical protein|nr:MAG: hypothetical protein CVU84_12030 [Firmicutes bacterium HGW-Firmicutes-1]